MTYFQYFSLLFFPSKNIYTFTGKERDEETGFSYFGARYYDSDLSGLFLSVDPMADKYPSLSPYAYCAWNPIKLVDPDGMKIDLSNLTNEQQSQYHKRIETLKKNEFFCYYYSKLEESNNNYCIQMLDNSDDSKSGYFIPNNNEVGFVDNIHVICQELFHAYQSEIGEYNDCDKSVRETEADIVSFLIAASVYAPCVGISEWDNGITCNPNYVDDNFNLKPDVLGSSQFDRDFTTAVNNRISFYNKRDLEEQLNSPASYIQNNSGREAKAIKLVLSAIYE